MQIELTKEAMTQIGTGKLAPFGVSEDNLRWKGSYTFDLADFTKAKTRLFRDLLDAHRTARGVNARVADVDRWLAILDGEKIRVKKIKDFAPMLKQYLKTAPKHWVYTRRDGGDVWQPYYVSNIHYEPPRKTQYGGYVPAHVHVTINWEELGEYHADKLTFWAEHCEDMPVGRALAEMGYVTETPEMWDSYAANRARYVAVHDKIGRQFWASGVATDDVESGGRREKSWFRRTAEIVMDRDGERSRVVVDVVRESDESESSSRERKPSGQFWGTEGCDYDGSADDDDRDIKPGDEDPDEDHAREEAEIPLKPALVCFDLRRHARLRIHVDQLADYEYRTDLAEKLILPDEVRSLVDLLVSHRGGFTDIVRGKSGGAVILCAGPPGTGKTLTAEVYSEAMCRPLYSVQCSQLGLTPEDLEEELLKVFARAQRWNAILLLDEADVYVAARGSDLGQNAIVGVFLRVLEYYGGVLFLTTNRADLVDDAVASRCLARIDYAVPTPANQRRIWRALSDTAGIPLDGKEIDKIVARFPGMSGRDVKNLLKLGSMVASAAGKPVTADTVAYVKQFKPTADARGAT